MSLDPALRQRIDTLLGENRVVLFMKGQPQAPQCGFSAKASGLLRELAVDFAHVDVLSDPDIREGIKLYGQWPTIPQLYIGGELVGGSDIIEQMFASGELQSALGLPPPDRTPPNVSLSPAAAQMLRKAIDDAGGEVVVELGIDPTYRTRLQLAQPNSSAIATTVDGIPLQFALSGARRAEGLKIDYADDERGRGLLIDNPNAPKPVRPLSPADTAARVAAGTLTLVDVRPAEERAMAAAPVACITLDNGIDPIGDLPPEQPLAFLCHHGGRSQQAAEHFRQQGHREVYNVDGGIDAWADIDERVARY
ncbi:MAG: Grx4 family monothiol glutaredoxin [Pseudoxanthomonas suwonensis]|nr:Grx4 family monothiol glutaredoxin [Pseudoxanthomonas suwonensis]